MGRIRTIKPEFFQHEGLFDLEQETGLPLRVAYAGLWTQCDREGRFRWEPRRLKANVLPYDNLDFARVLDALWSRGFLRKYESQSGVFGVIPVFGSHQHINPKERSSSLPGPDDNCCRIIDFTRQARVDDATSTRDIPANPPVTDMEHGTRNMEQVKKESPNGDGETGSRRSRTTPSAEQVILYQRRDGLVEYLRKKLEVKVLPDLKKQKGCALKLVKEYSDADCIAEFERQWSGGWRDKADWATVWSDIAQRKARANGVDHGEMPEIFRGAI